MIDLNKHKLKLDYPCGWKYKIVTLEDVDLDKISQDIFKDREHSIKESNVSKKGKFKSHTIELIVHSDEDREELHKVLTKHDDIKIVL